MVLNLKIKLKFHQILINYEIKRYNLNIVKRDYIFVKLKSDDYTVKTPLKTK